jgi:hypothetical protein
MVATGGCTVSSRRVGLTGPSGTPGELPPGQSSAGAVAYPSAFPRDRASTCEAAGGVWVALTDSCRYPR